SSAFWRFCGENVPFALVRMGLSGRFLIDRRKSGRCPLHGICALGDGHVCVDRISSPCLGTGTAPFPSASFLLDPHAKEMTLSRHGPVEECAAMCSCKALSQTTRQGKGQTNESISSYF